MTCNDPPTPSEHEQKRLPRRVRPCFLQLVCQEMKPWMLEKVDGIAIDVLQQPCFGWRDSGRAFDSACLAHSQVGSVCNKEALRGFPPETDPTNHRDTGFHGWQLGDKASPRFGILPRSAPPCPDQPPHRADPTNVFAKELNRIPGLMQQTSDDCRELCKLNV